jgi:hypothetical protein
MHLWIQNDLHVWEAQALTTMGYLRLHQDGRVAWVAEDTDRQALLHPWQETTGAASYLLLVKPGAGVRLNGRQPLSLSLLQDRDEITLGKTAVYFTTETLPVVVPFPGSADTLFCARCKGALNTGELALQCPGCQLWYHAHDTRPCWTYHTHCVCAYPTHGDFVWRPAS